MSNSSSSEKVQKLLFDAAVQIAVHDGPENPVFRHLVDELQQQSQPLSTTVGEIAGLYDLPAADVLDAVIRSGCRMFWWNGKPYEAEGIRKQIGGAWQWDLTPEIEVDLTPQQRQRLDELLGEGAVADPPPAESQRPLRKFIASDAQLPQQAGQRRQRLG